MVGFVRETEVWTLVVCETLPCGCVGHLRVSLGLEADSTTVGTIVQALSCGALRSECVSINGWLLVGSVML